jgi:hypothetical protein
MTYISKFRSTKSTVLAVYTCPTHGEFDCEVERDELGNAPDAIECTQGESYGVPCVCGEVATWTPSPIGVRVRRLEVVRGKWEKPERPTYLDTRNLGDGQSLEEFQAERKKVWERKREAEVMAVKKGF